MTCPKCKARIGIYKQAVTVETGPVFGTNCFICGYWLHEGSHQQLLPKRVGASPRPPRAA